MEARLEEMKGERPMFDRLGVEPARSRSRSAVASAAVNVSGLCGLPDGVAREESVVRACVPL